MLAHRVLTQRFAVCGRGSLTRYAARSVYKSSALSKVHERSGRLMDFWKQSRQVGLDMELNAGWQAGLRGINPIGRECEVLWSSYDICFGG